MPLSIDSQVLPDYELHDLSDDAGPPPVDYFDGDEGPDGSRWLTVATFWEPTEAHIARLKLESEEIDCMIIDENLVATYWFWASALGGVKLQVRESDFPQAHELLHRDQPISDGQHNCPHCGSSAIGIQIFSRRIPFIRLRQACSSCGFQWKP